MQAPADFHGDIVMGRQGEQLWQIGERLRGRWRLVRLWQAEVVDHQPRIGIPGRQLGRLVQAPRTRQVNRQGVLRRRGQNAVDDGIGGVGRNVVSQEDPDADSALVAAQSAIVSVTAGSVGSTGLTSLNRLGCTPYTSRA